MAHLHDHHIGGLVFDGSFDSGNAAERVEQIGDDEFCLWTLRDCEGTPGENGCRSWFCFSVRGALTTGRTLAFRIHNMNSQGNLFRHDMRPVYRSLPSKPEWDRLPVAATHWGGKAADKYKEMRENTKPADEDGFVVRFEHTIDTPADETLYFAFCFPASGGAAAADDVAMCDEWLLSGTGPSRAQMETATAAVALAASLAPAAAPDRAAIYYHRELLTRSLDGRRIDLLTISGTSGLLAAREAPLAELASAGLPSCSSEGGVSARRFDASKSVFLLTARVHPGESPASHVFEGVVRFLLDEADPRARLLRERFVFKLVPMINPDGVYRGYYRSDTRGVNLNRVYCAPEPALHPSVFAITALVKQLHEAGQLHFYIDCHAHSNKRGCFLFGNALEADEMLSNVLYAKLVQQNSRWFDFEGCEFKFSEKLANQYAKDARDGNGAGKEGSGRVGVYKLTGLTHVYTLECNYNTGRIVNRLGHPFAPEGTDQDRSLSPQPPLRCLHPKYSPETWQSVGKALAVSALDVLQINPCSRLGGLGSAEYTMNRSRLKSTVAAYIRTKERAAVQKAAKKAKASFNLKSAQINRLENAARVQVLETRRTLDGGLRAAISLRGRRGHRHGWMTLIMKDGKENAELVSPQPELELPPAGAAFAEEAAADESEPVAAGERKGGMAFVF